MGMILGKIDVETPAHKVLKKTPVYEIREYPGAVAACTYSDEYDSVRGYAFMNAGFRSLAGYIGVWQNGQNANNAQIAMTAPVVCRVESKEPKQQVTVTKNLGDRDMMAFLLPKDFTLENAPKPLSSKVHLEQIPPRVLAVQTFSGAHDMQSMKVIADKLIETLGKDNVKVAEDTQVEYAFYNPPYTLPFLRTNEVFIPLAPGETFAQAQPAC